MTTRKRKSTKRKSRTGRHENPTFTKAIKKAKELRKKHPTMKWQNLVKKAYKMVK